MKKTGLLLILLALIIALIPAYAATTTGRGDEVARNGGLAAFMNSTGSIYISGQSTPMNQTPAKGVLSIDAYRIVFFATNGDLMSISLDTNQETVLTKDAAAACVANDSVYYVSKADSKKLIRCDIDSGKTQTVLTATENLNRVYSTSSGVIAAQVSNSGAYIQDAVSGKFIAYNGDIANEIQNFDTFDVYTDSQKNLYVKTSGASSGAFVDSNVQDWAVIGSNIYYITGVSSNITLKSYSTANATWNIVFVPNIEMEPQLTASAGTLFMLGKNNIVYCVDVSNRCLVKFATLPDKSSYNVTSGKQVTGFTIEAVSGQLNVYGTVSGTDTLPTFTFVDSTSTVVSDTSSETMLLCAYAIDGEDTVSALLKPAPQYSTLRRGSRGEAVSAIQQPLYDLGYYNYYIDGIYGWRTELAVEMLQSDLGLRVTGVANADLQKLILAGGLEPYSPYRQISIGSTGWRVRNMQERLRDLGYLADDADGIFGERTEAAVELFQQENGLTVNGVANEATLKRLYSSNAAECSSYIELRRGDSGYRVRALNERLKELYYLEGDAGSYYSSATAEAVRRFQAEIGLRQSGRASASLQSKLFSRSAPEYSGYITLRRGDDNSRVEELQRRLSKLNYFDGNCTGYYGAKTQQAVWLFQRMNGLYADGVADPETLAAIFDRNASEYNPPKKIGTPEITLSSFVEQQGNEYVVSTTTNPTGSTTASWFTDGDVASYDIIITDANGNICLTQDNVSADTTMLDIPIDSLTEDLRYQLTITAHPYDYADDSDTEASIFFTRKEVSLPIPVTNLIITPQGEGISYFENIYNMAQENLSFMWIADGDVRGYAYKVTDTDGNAIAFSQDVTDTREVQIAANLLKQDSVYTLTVCAVPVDHALEDPETLTSSIQFRPVATTPAETPDETPDGETVDQPSLPDGLAQDASNVEVSADQNAEAPADVVTQIASGDPAIGEDIVSPEQQEAIDAADEPDDASDVEIPVEPTPEPAVEATEEPAAEPTMEPVEPAVEVTEEPAAEPTMEPVEPAIEVTEEPAAEPTLEPVTIEAPVLSIEPNNGSTPVTVYDENGNEMQVDAYLLAEGDLAFSWYAEGAGSYLVQISDENGNLYVDQTLEITEAGMNSANLQSNMIYRLHVTAIAAADSGVTADADLYFLLSAAEEPVVEEPVVEEPVVEEPIVEEPVGEEPVVEEPVPTEEPYVEPDPTEEPYVEPDPTEEPYVEPDPTEEPYVEEPYIPDEEPYEPDDSEMEPQMTDGSVIWAAPIDAYSDSETIAALQQRLVDCGWLNVGDYTEGALDDATIDAVIRIQQYMSERGVNYMICDPMDPVVDVATLQLMFDESLGMTFENPEM